MKKVFTILGLSLVIAACGGKSGSTGSDSTADANKTAVAIQSDAAQDTSASHNGTEKTGGVSNDPGAQLIASNDCSTCHKEKDKVVGPAFADVAQKYAGASPAVIDTLAHKIINGGSGHWGDVSMSAHPSLAVADAQKMVKYILTVKK